MLSAPPVEPPLALVGNGQDEHVPRTYLVDDAVGERGEDELPSSASDFHTYVRKLADAGESPLQFSDERRTQIGTLEVVVVGAVVEFAIILLVEADAQPRHPRARPKQRWSYEPTSNPAQLAAAYAFGLARNHPFQDGNKRIAFVVMAVFVGLNGHEVMAPEADVVTVMRAVAAGEMAEEELAEWLESCIRPAGAR